MCFNIHKNHKEPEIAGKDIKCWKILLGEDTYSPIFYGEDYEKGVLQPFVEFAISDHYLHDKVIDEGYHSYTSVEKAKKELSHNNDFYYQEMKASKKSLIIVEFTIPKGVSYYYNPDTGERVSNQIIAGEVVEKIDEIEE